MQIVPSVLCSVERIHVGSVVLSPDMVGLEQVVFFDVTPIADGQRPVLDRISEGLPYATRLGQQ